jgi:hypothetical protein
MLREEIKNHKKKRWEKKGSMGSHASTKMANLGVNRFILKNDV